MIEYRIDYAGMIVTVSIDAVNPSDRAVIQYSGEKRAVVIVENWLTFAYGAFGHLIGGETTPIDLDAAISTMPDVFKLVESTGPIPQRYNPEIPEDSLT